MKGYENSKIPNLFTLMDEKGIKATQITRDLEISSGNISNWKVGKSVPAKAVLYALAAYLNTTVSYLLGESDQKEKSPDNEGLSELEAEIIKVFSSLSDHSQQDALRYLAYLEHHSENDNTGN